MQRINHLVLQSKIFSKPCYRRFSSANLKPNESKGNLLKGKTGPWEVVIGLEIHCQLDTKSKLFSSGPGIGPESLPNHESSIVDAAFPGTLPVLNRACVDKAIRMGLALSGNVNTWSSFDRKHYFYFDMPQGYQITQFHEPIVRGGKLTINMPDQSTKEVRITQIQLEQDSAKSLHEQHPDYSLIDLNRAGSALIEIVTEADMRSSLEAYQFIKKLQHLVRHVGVSTANMEEGEFRCDVNVSVNRPGEPWGTRTEIKNLNSPKYALKAIEFEAKRHIDLIENGEKIIKQTRFFNAEKGETVLMRQKEEEMDYRFLPEPDLPPLYVSEELVQQIKADMPELPHVTRGRFLEKHGLSPYDTDVLIDSNADKYFEQVAVNRNPKKVAAWIINELFGYKTDEQEMPISAERLGSLIDLVESGVISGRVGKEILPTMITDLRDPKEIVQEKGLTQLSDESALQSMCEQAIQESPAELKKYQSGREGVFRHFVAKVMQYSKGKANPKRTAEILKEMIDKMPK